MQIISGTITKVDLPDFTDTHNNQYQNITVKGESGRVMVGRIACKSPYTTEDIGKKGKWEATKDSNSRGDYNRFKKHYDTPYGGQQGPQQGGQQAPQRTTQYVKKEEPDWDAIAAGKTLCNVVCAYIQAGEVPEEVACWHWTDFIMKKRLRGPQKMDDMSELNQPVEEDSGTPQGGNPNLDYVGDNPKPPEGKIPF